MSPRTANLSLTPSNHTSPKLGSLRVNMEATVLWLRGWRIHVLPVALPQVIRDFCICCMSMSVHLPTEARTLRLSYWDKVTCTENSTSDAVTKARG